MSATTLNSRSRLARFCTTPTSPYPVRLFISGPQDVSLFHHRQGPCAVPRRSRRERQDRRQSAGGHAKQPTTALRLNSRSCVYPPSSPLVSLARLLITFTRVSVFASQPRGTIFNLTTRLRRRCEFSRFCRPRINNPSRKHRLASLRTNESKLKGRQSTFLFPRLLTTPSILYSTPPRYAFDLTFTFSMVPK